MRLLIFSPFYPPHIGGLETHSAEFNRFAAQAGHIVTVFTPRLPESSPVEETFKNVKVFRYPAIELIHNYPLPRFWTAEFWRLWDTIQDIPADTIISRTRFFYSSLMAWRLAQKRRLAWIHVEHGSDFVYFRTNWKSLLAKAYDLSIGRLVLQRADLVIANSIASREFVQQLSGRSDCEVIYRGVDTKLIRGTRPEISLREKYPDKVIVAYIGRLIDGKGVTDLVSAFTSTNPSQAALVIVGSGPEKQRLEVLVEKLGLQDRCFFTGALPLPEALEVLAASDIIVNPSYGEGIPTNVIEAALMKKSIIATDVGGTREIISGNGDGFLVLPKDIPMLTEKLNIFIENLVIRQAVGKAAYAKVSNMFSWEKSIERYTRVIKMNKVRKY